MRPSPTIAIMTFGVILSVACGSPARKAHELAGPSSTDARQLVERYLAADTLGNGLSQAIDSLFTECEGDRATDGVVATKAAGVVGLAGAGDTLGVVVEYSELGWLEWNLIERLRSGTWRFQPRPLVTRETIFVAFDAQHTLRLVCGAHHGNHWSVSVINALPDRMDSTSARLWRETSKRASR